ncbi:MAG TPA: Rrf2 family transcriptional regulator [Xanthomonadales bacterium]|nr:Rrf2 family transcriptional regulator [Xanthomonadales bacterium]
MKAKYALRALCTLARRDREPLAARVLAEDAHIPEKFLETILVELRNAGFVDSRRGLAGGHRLARPADAIVVGDVIRALDGPLAPLRCASVTAYRPCDDCADPAACALRHLMGDVRDAIASVLDTRTLQQLAAAERAAVPVGS